jgi:hypothetical protein
VSDTELDRYVAALGAALRGPRGAKADLLAEVRHSLLDATEAYQEKGLSRVDAAGRAVAEFGGPAEIAPDYQAELAVAQGRRTALLMLVGLAGLAAAAPVLWHAPWPGQPPADGWLAQWFNGLSLGGAGLALLARLGFGWGSRYVPDSVRLTRTLGRAGLGFLALHGLAGLAVYLPRLAYWPGVLHRPTIWLALAAMALAFGYVALCAWRCLSVTRLSYA